MKKINQEPKRQQRQSGISYLNCEEWSEFLSSDMVAACGEDLKRIVSVPLIGFANKESNLFRARLVELSLSLCSDKTLVFTKQYQRQMSQNLSQLLEALHAGSLIIDDIQDAANFRRRGPALHTEIGVPLAINSGGLLYFLALSLIEKMEFEPRIEIAVSRLCHRAMVKGHLGQALDLGVRIDEVSQVRARELSIAALKLKTGALMSLATELCAVACGVHPEVRNALKNFGLNFGFALQSFNDLGDYSCNNQSLGQDLILGKPTWIWVCASESLSAHDYREFQNQASRLRSADLKSQRKIMLELKNHALIKFAADEARRRMSETFHDLSRSLQKFDYELNQRPDWKDLQSLAQKVMVAYA